ncbi:MAG: hypothetical protein HC884_20000 [Chloroflexaceae bacterium]|nr:hypothetical protein [Chloroflexaceae bacterium]
MSATSLRNIARLTEKRMAPYAWTQVDDMSLSSEEQTLLNALSRRLSYYDTSFVNEATIWSRAIYPMLVLAEQGEVLAWSQVPIRAQYPHVELQGVVDGMLAQGIIGMADAPYYLIVVEAKRGLESQDPRFQLCGQLLAAARLNWECDQQPVQEIFGCYTIIDTWKFLRATVQDIETDAPHLLIEPSREYTQKTEAETILKILKRIVAGSTAPSQRGNDDRVVINQ